MRRAPAALEALGLAALTAVALCPPLEATPEALDSAQEAGLFAGVARALHEGAADALFAGLPLPVVDFERGSRLPVAAFRRPERLRPCCAFGHALGVSIAGVRLPGLRVDNLVDPTRLGHHHYDAAVLAWDNGLDRAFVSSESNGLVYTRRGGFVDLAHVRQYADWTVYLAQEIAERIPGGGAIGLPREGGQRVVRIEAVRPGWLRRAGRDEAAVALAEWVAWQLSVWHELATLYGWSSTPFFSERVSAFSPEDLYSNLLGIHLAGAVLRAGGAETRERWERNMDAALAELLRRLGAVGRVESARAAAFVDGFWWDSQRALPSPELVLQRNAELGPTIVPWRVALPGAAGAPADAEPALLRVVERAGGRPAGTLARLEVRPSQRIARAMPAALAADGVLSQDRFELAARAGGVGR